jgi:hypothetical protein
MKIKINKGNVESVILIDLIFIFFQFVIFLLFNILTWHTEFLPGLFYPSNLTLEKVSKQFPLQIMNERMNE